MSRHPIRPSLPSLALLALIVLTPTLATAFPQNASLRSDTEHSSTAPGLFGRLRDLLSSFWMTGSILDPNGTSGAASPGSGTAAGATGDTGSGLEPNG